MKSSPHISCSVYEYIKILGFSKHASILIWIDYIWPDTWNLGKTDGPWFNKCSFRAGSVCTFFPPVISGLIWPVVHGLLTHNLNNKLYVFSKCSNSYNIKHNLLLDTSGYKRCFNRFYKEVFGSHLKEKILTRMNRIAKGREICI